jgi:type IV secretory pathway TraG/TraD family ATPase VirD4
MDELYNENLRTSIINNCNNYCLLKTGDDKTTQVEANIIGTSEKWKKSVSSSHESYSENEQTQIDYVVLPSDFSKLEDFTGYFKILTKWYEFSLKKEKYVERPVVAEPFIARKDLTYNN